MNAITYLAAIACTASVCAQSVTLSADLVTGGTLIALVGGTPQSQALVTGPLLGSGAQGVAVGTSNGSAGANVAWSRTPPSNNEEIQFVHRISAETNASVAASASVPVHEVIVSLTAAAPRQVFFECSIETQLIASFEPSIEVDVGNDGSIDLLNRQPILSGSVTVGPTPLEVRIRSSGTVATATNGYSLLVANTKLVIRPDNAVQLTKTVTGCANTEFMVHQAFAFDGIRLDYPFAVAPSLAVLGLAPQVTILPSLTSFPCILLPSPDAVMLMPFGAGIDIPIPPAARPITFYAQAVSVHALDNLQSTDGYHIAAY